MSPGGPLSRPYLPVPKLWRPSSALHRVLRGSRGMSGEFGFECGDFRMHRVLRDTALKSEQEQNDHKGFRPYRVLHPLGGNSRQMGRRSPHPRRVLGGPQLLRLLPEPPLRPVVRIATAPLRLTAPLALGLALRPVAHLLAVTEPGMRDEPPAAGLAGFAASLASGRGHGAIAPRPRGLSRTRGTSPRSSAATVPEDRGTSPRSGGDLYAAVNRPA